jgi:integrase
MGRFSVFKRGKYYYCQLKNPETGKYLPAKSTGQTSRDEALLIVADWLREGLPDRPLRQALDLDTILYTIKTAEFAPGDAERIITALKSRGLIESAVIAGDGADTELLIDFLYRFWDYEKSPYVREKLAYGHSIGKRHCQDQGTRLPHWKDYFPKDTRLRDVTRDRLRDFQLHLKEKGLAPKTVNLIIDAGVSALAWAADKGILRENPGAGLRKFSGKSKKRGILDPKEIKKLFSVPWKDERARVGNLIAATTGLRAGEVLALRICDILPEYINVEHSFSRADGLKGTKTDEARTVPLLPAVKTEIERLIAKNPHGQHPENFIFYSDAADRPMSQNILRRGLYSSLEDIKIDPKARNLTVHSWRHAYAAQLSGRIDITKVQRATGHRSGAMAQHYADHQLESDLKEVAAAVSDVYGKIIPFEKKRGTA